MEERGDRLDLVAALARRLAEPELVERADRERVEQPFGVQRGARRTRARRERTRGGALRGRQVVERGVVAARQHRSAEVRAAGEAVDPRDGVAVALVAVEHPRHAVVDVDGAFGVDDHVRGLDRLELQRRLGDDAGEAHAAGGRPEHVARRVRAVSTPRAGVASVMRCDGVGERAVPELAVDVGGDRAADGDVPRAGHDHREPSERQEHAHQHLDADAGLDRAGPLGDVELEDAVELRAAHDVAAAVLRGVAVAAPEAARR